MFEINLIREKAMTPEFKKQLNKRASLAVFASLTIIIGLLMYCGKITADIRTNKNKKSAVTETIGTIINQYKIIEWGKEWVGFYKQMNLIHRAYYERVYVAVRMAEIHNLLPDKMCIDQIGMGADTKKMTIKLIALIDGQIDFESINSFIGTLKKSGLFGEGVKLESQETTVLNNRDVSMITISIPLRDKDG